MRYLAAVALHQPERTEAYADGISQAVWVPIGLFPLEEAARQAVRTFTEGQACDAFVILPEKSAGRFPLYDRLVALMKEK